MQRKDSAAARKKRPAPVADSDSDDQGSDSDSPPPAATAATPGKRKSTTTGQKSGRGKGAAADASEDEERDASGEDTVGVTGKKGKGLSQEQRHKLVQDIARYALFCEVQRKPLKREDMVKTLLANGKGRYFNELLPEVQKHLKGTLGMELVLLRQKEATVKNPPKAYVLRTTVPPPLVAAMHTRLTDLLEVKSAEALLRMDAPTHPLVKDTHELSLEQGYLRDMRREEGGAYGVLGVVLALILVSGKVLGDDQLISYLKRLGLHPDTLVPSSVASSSTGLTVVAFLALLAKQGYLERLKPTAHNGAVQATQSKKSTKATADAGDASVQWKWGPRADAELGEVGVAEFVRVIYESKVGGGADEDGPVRRKGNTGEKLLSEIARAAGEGTLSAAKDVKGL